MARANLDKKPADVAKMFDDVAPRYDITNTFMTGGMETLWRRSVMKVLDARPGDRVLDIAAGTGTSSAILADAGVDVVPADFSMGMLQQGRRRRPDLSFTAADAMALPFADESFDAVTISYGIRNVVDPDAALREFLRVTRPGGVLVIAEFSQPVVPGFRELYKWYLGKGLPAVAARVSSDAESYMYLSESIMSWPAQSALASRITSAGWKDVRWRNLTGGIVAVHRGVKR
ncbi:demethylmenaquinone methyltransferase [Dermatophilus congolensis]|uniref:Demethylmenaquinone methyltransferase n=1 Tax=Dermatophilus congolensis TaxID=1863 RepID=A0AA46BNZ6_9MICO|nr:demethylmenaquinone methyltransferase [Dermatophilus congolensis]MBO3143249.1 demethylmenaquinone methyltransferase [Dermatophilus congolensis]MBO3152233.1 demethylmenaquinone methyltransferase [Dermatophilus congolensis]MBO3160754.1 demethylmenaquinone methyltransferase [Dermatophilus congolensis]MBO3163524.1 demethylmenaquinone methyltransferase [Dermatophilus congolensis]MBO3177070.1 demethylmenaquinone methyltransferase [Dermatophilus congolensis]